MLTKKSSPGKYLQKFPPKLATVDDSVRTGAGGTAATAPAVVLQARGPHLVSPARSAVATPLGRSLPSALHPQIVPLIAL